jgi:uncharacterized protein DUF6321
LTAVGRKAFARSEGGHLRPGVTRKASDMTLSDMRRKGSWAVRFYGRKKLPPLVDRQGWPTGHASVEVQDHVPNIVIPGRA